MPKQKAAESIVYNARELEGLRFRASTEQRIAERMQQISQLESEMARRNLLYSRQRYVAQPEIVAQGLAQAIDDQIDIRRDMIRIAPELGSDPELDSLLASVHQRINGFLAAPPSHHPLGEAMLRTLAPALEQQQERAAARLRIQASLKIDILRHEVALNMHKASQNPAVTTGDGPVVVNLGTIYGSVQQVIGNVGGTGDSRLADYLKQLADAIRDADSLGGQRAACLEQVRFLAEQVSLKPHDRQPASIIRSVFAALRETLQGAANAANILLLAGPAIARHFGFGWPF